VKSCVMRDVRPNCLTTNFYCDECGANKSHLQC
jgi:hypothetical protein